MFASSTITTFEQRLTLERIASVSSGTSEAQVEHLDRGAVEVLRRLQRDIDHRAVGDYDEVLARARDPRRERRLVDPLGDVALDPAIEVLVAP